MYWIEHTASGPRLVSDSALNASDFFRLASEFGTAPKRARKTGRVAARQALRRERIETRWNGKETQNSAAPGDWIVTALAADGEPLRDASAHLNIYVVTEGRFSALYSAIPNLGVTAHGAIFEPRGIVQALRLTGGFEIKAPWGESQLADDGWLLLSGSEVYGNHSDTFDATYELLD